MYHYHPRCRRKRTRTPVHTADARQSQQEHSPQPGKPQRPCEGPSEAQTGPVLDAETLSLLLQLREIRAQAAAGEDSSLLERVGNVVESDPPCHAKQRKQSRTCIHHRA
jgi:hypothetical protein